MRIDQRRVGNHERGHGRTLSVRDDHYRRRIADPAPTGGSNRGQPGRDLDAARGVTLGAGLLGGGLLFASVLLPWSRSGAGSAISARHLGDLALSGTIEAWVSRWLGAAIYVVPASGALVLIGSGLGGRSGLVVNLVGVVAAGTVVGIALAQLAGKADLGVGPGAMLALIGLAASVVATAAGSRGRGRALSPRTNDEPA